MYVHGALYNGNSVKTHQHLDILTKQIMQDYCRGKQKGSNIKNLNMKPCNSDKLSHFKMVKIYCTQHRGGMTLFLSPPSTVTLRQWYPGTSGLKLLFKVQWLCSALLSSDQSSSSASYLQLQIRGIFICQARKRPNFPLLPWAHHITVISFCILWRTARDRYGVCLTVR